MSKDLKRGERRLDDDYNITLDDLSCSTSLPGRFLLLLIPIFSILLTTGAILAIIYNVREFDVPPGLALTISASVGVGVFLLGLIGGKIWQTIGRIMATSTYMVYLKENKTIFQRIFGWFYTKFVEKDAQVYLEGRAEDPRLGNILNLIKLVARISISQVSFFIVATQFLSRPLVNYIVSLLPGIFLSRAQQLIAQNVLALGISVVLMTLYLPMSFIIEDSNIRTWIPKDRKISTPSETIRNQIDSIVSFGAILTGWGIYQTQILDQGTLFFLNSLSNQWVLQGFDVVQLVDYLLWLIGLLLLSWPFILPAAYYYFLTHHKTVNNFRATAHSKGVPIGVSKVRLPDTGELHVIQEFVEKNK